MAGGPPKGHPRYGGKKKGTLNKATVERLESERVARQAQQEVDKARRAATKLGKDVLEEFMKLFAGMAAQYQPLPVGMAVPAGRAPDEAKFLTYAKLTVETARDLAQFQSPKFKAIQIVAPPPSPAATAPTIDQAGNVVQLNDPVAAARVYQNMMKQVRG